MAVMMPREKWTDDRLDDLNKKVDDGFAETKAEMREGFARVDAQIARLDGDIKELRRDTTNQIDGLRGEMNERFNSVDARFDSVNRNMIAGFFVVVAAIIGSSAF
jgi:hypothetical protein